MKRKNVNIGLSVVEREYLKLLKPELQQAIEQGEPERAASFAKELARLRRKESQHSNKGDADDR